MAVLGALSLTLELIPHCTSVPREGWVGSHDIRPLAELGLRQAEALVTAVGVNVDGVYSSPTIRCRQTVGPLAAAAGLLVQDLAGLYEAGDFGEPTAADADPWPELMTHAVGGAWAAGRMLRAVTIMAGAHPGGRVAAASHGDVVPALLAVLSSAYDVPWPRHVGRGGWYTLQFASTHLAVTAHNEVGIDLGPTAE